MPWERLFQDFEQGSPFNDLSLPRKSPGQRPGFSSSFGYFVELIFESWLQVMESGTTKFVIQCSVTYLT